MGKTSGSLRSVVIDGISYSFPADADVSMKFSSFETEGLATSGDTMYKMTISNPMQESVPLTVNADEIETLRAAAAKTSDYSMSLAMADGVEYKAQGRINLKERSSADGRVEVDLIPNNALTGWQKF
jgi:hypothetical protein